MLPVLQVAASQYPVSLTTTNPAQGRTSKRRADAGLLRLIAIFKFFKAAALIATGIAALKLVHADVGALVEHWVAMLNLDPGGRLVNHAIQRATNLSPHRIRELGIVSFIYAALFLVEGTGLWLQRRWGEWVTVIITGSLVPVEIYETIHRPTALRGVVLLINIAVVIYLIYRIRHEQTND